MPLFYFIMAILQLSSDFIYASSDISKKLHSNIDLKLLPVVIQGPMPIECEMLAGFVENRKEIAFGPYLFWAGTINNYPVIVSKTLKGIANSAAATVLAIEKFHPIAVINQGTSGGNDPDLHVCDIVLGTTLINAGSLKTGKKERGEGSNPLEWKPLDFLRSETSAGEDPDALTLRKFESDPLLVEIAKSVADKYKKGRIVEGTVSSGEVWNSELDRIKWYHDHFGSSVEEAEGASAAQICHLYNVPFLSIRILSNNITNNGAYLGCTGEYCQEYVYEVVKALIKVLPRPISE